MNDHPHQQVAPPGGDMADHIVEARQRARRLLSGESHLGVVDDAFRSLVRARDGILLIWLVWLVLDAFSVQVDVGRILVAVGAGASILAGLVAGLATRQQVLHFEAELERERHEIKTQPEHEREEVRSLYAAKGFVDPLLTQIVDTLCADDDRLLKVMMEEELGLFTHGVNHPVLVGLWNAGWALAGALAMALPVCLLAPDSVDLWLPIGGAVLLAIIALAVSRRTGRFLSTLVGWLIIGGVTGGLVHFLSGMLAGR